MCLLEFMGLCFQSAAGSEGTRDGWSASPQVLAEAWKGGSVGSDAGIGPAGSVMPLKVKHFPMASPNWTRPSHSHVILPSGLGGAELGSLTESS